MKKLLFFDTKLSQYLLLSSDSSWWHTIRLVAHLGDGQYVFGGLLLVYLSGWVGHNRFLQQAGLVLTLIILATFLGVTSLKFVIRRQRPNPPGEFVAFSHDRYSFPSGHSARMAALSVGTLFFYPTIGWILILITLAVALARITVGVHYLSDVVVGLCTGAITALVGVAFLQHLFLG